MVRLGCFSPMAPPSLAPRWVELPFPRIWTGVAMAMNDTPNGERTRIVLLGRCNVGKSSLVNALAGQPVAIVSDVRGTTTDPVRKAMEILPLGPVLLCDTPGLDDAGELGELRMSRTRTELRQADLALVVVDAALGVGDAERAIIQEVKALGIPGIVALNRADLSPVSGEALAVVSAKVGLPALAVSATGGQGIDDLKRALVKALPEEPDVLRLAADFVKPGDVVVLVVPIDKAAPKGRLILPQQQVIRDLLDVGAMPFVVRDTELASALDGLKTPPALVITDSQAFRKVAGIVPAEIPLTSFSILFARYKGDLKALAAGARAVAGLKDGDKILIAEGCTHHRQDDDIGTVKIPNMLLKATGRKLVFEHCAGMGYPDNLADYALVVHCGGCMLGRREMLARIHAAQAAGVPIVNYGVLIAALTGVLDRALLQ